MTQPPYALSTSYVPLWRPLSPIKGGPRHTGEGFGFLDYARTVASSRTQEHSNTHQSRTRVLRILAARTWVNDPCADYQTRSLHNPAPANHRRDPSDSIGVVSTDIFGAPGRGRSCGNLVWLEQRLHRGRHSKEEDEQTGGVICGCGERPRNNRKAKSCKTLSNSFLYIRLSSSKILPCVWKTCMQWDLATIGNALALFRVRSTVQAAALRMAGWLAW